MKPSNPSPRKNCRNCKGCLTQNCGKCRICVRMIMFGGDGRVKEKCLLRKCEKWQVSNKAIPSILTVPSLSTDVHKKSSSKMKDFASLSKPKVSSDKADNSKLTDNNVQFPGSEQKVVLEMTPKKASQNSVKQPHTPRGVTKQRVSESSPKPTVTESTPERRSMRNRTTSVTKSQATDDVAPPVQEYLVQQSNFIVESLPGTEITNAVTEKDNKTMNAENKEEQIQDLSKLTSDTDTEELLSEKAAAMSSKPDVQLPKLQLDSMTKRELKEFIPKLLKLVTGKEKVFYSRRSAKPEWWPDNVTWVASRSAWYNEKYWTDSLKLVVKNCYKHVGKEDLLQSFVDSATRKEFQSTDLEANLTSGCYPSSPIKIRMFPQDLFLPFSAEIYICYFCEKEFLSKEKMRVHQKGCFERPPDLQKIFLDTGKFESKTSSKPLPMTPIKWPNQSLEKFVGNVGLVPKLTAANLLKQRPSVQEIDCEILDEVEPISPVTPKTPKSLISQLSREDHNHGTRKRLSYSMSEDKDSVTINSDSDSDSELESEAQRKPVHEMNLLDIPVSSLLGQRIKKYVHVDAPVSLVENSESFCRTPVKNSFLEKLRKKELAYPMLYRPRRIANLHKQNHIYKFKKQEVKEFMCKTSFGLSYSSVNKLHSMKKLSIRVQRLSRKALLNWVPRRVLDKQLKGVFKGLKYNPYSDLDDLPCEFPSGPTLLAKNIDKMLGLKKRCSQDSISKMALSLSNFISEEMEAEISKQKLTLYRSLLYEMSVLKPAVVMEDIGNQMKAAKMQPNMPSRGKKVNTPRDEANKIKEERLIAEAKERERKGEFKVLRSLLNTASAQNKTPCDIKLDAFNTPLFVTVDNVRSKPTMKSPIDDSLSIVSVSSEGESVHSNCCQGCHNNKFTPDLQIASGRSTNKADLVNSDVEQQLQVDVDLTPTVDEYGIPSPVSVSCESPYPLSQNKTIQDSPLSTRTTPSSKGDMTQTKVTEESEVTSKKRVRLSVDQKVAKQKSGENQSYLRSSRSGAGLVDSSVKNSPRFNRVKGETFSASSTPSHSPVKKAVKLGGSVPNSPVHRSNLRSNGGKNLNIQGQNVLEEDLKFRLITRSLSERGQGDFKQCSLKKCFSAGTENLSDLANDAASVENTKVLKSSISVLDSALRRSKRRLSSSADSVQHAKLQKVSSKLAGNLG